MRHKNSHKRLSERAVRAIRANRNGWSVKQRAWVYGVAPSTIYGILSGEQWGHVGDAERGMV